QARLALNGVSRSTEEILPPNPFPQLSSQRQITIRELFDALKAKHPMRNLLHGGPIKQPDSFVAFKQDEEALSRMREKYGYEGVEDASCPEYFADLSGLYDFRVFTDQLLTGKIAFPVTYKPNQGARGIRIFFIEKVSGGGILITMAYD